MSRPEYDGPAPLRSIGLYLGVAPTAGGMFQYAQSVVEALSRLDATRYRITVAHGDADWAPILARLGLAGHALRHAHRGSQIADAAMALRLPVSLIRMLSPLVNPLVRELRELDCETWIFPAQESVTYQVPGVRAIGTIHDLMHRYEPHFPEVSARFRHGIREHRFRNIACCSDAVLVDSEVGRVQVVESYHVPNERIWQLPYVAPSYLLDTTPRADFDAHYGLPERFVFYPAQFWPHKNHLRLLEAISIVANAHPDIALVLSGGKQHAFEQVQAQAKALCIDSKVFFVGYVPDADLAGFYKRARALVMPTFFGPTNIPPLEALALGCPAIVSGIYGMPEQSGDAALYFNPNCAKEMAAQITRVWTDDGLAASMSLRGVERSQHQGQAQFNHRLAQIIDAVVDGVA
ncbi:glycosyltransferase family 4 protein [Rhodoferax bucti]|uniref:glycosyltransferase family 4 protein n=1 Tax=Rhodoferax bucti TaxID=2576305 RepID=UPI0019802136|nr:glycosyltransferase family 1 protein [Rhodoferax bucti]